MLVVFAAILAAVTFVILTRLLWLNWRPGKASTLITLAAAGLIIGLAILAATGRMHWLAAVGAAVVPFLRRGFGLIRYLPWVRQLYEQSRQRPFSGAAGGASASDSGDMSPVQAREILGLGTHPSDDEMSARLRGLQC